MPEGTVKFFNTDKGYGFIEQSGGDDIFVHISNVVGGVDLQDGQSVEFEVGDGRKGPEAREVKPS